MPTASPAQAQPQVVGAIASIPHHSLPRVFTALPPSRREQLVALAEAEIDRILTAPIIPGRSTFMGVEVARKRPLTTAV